MVDKDFVQIEKSQSQTTSGRQPIEIINKKHTPVIGEVKFWLCGKRFFLDSI